jgi:hypothetical protein
MLTARAHPDSLVTSEGYGGWMNRRKLLARLAHGAVANVAFADMRSLVEGFGFELRRVNGSHHIFAHRGVPELINLQDVRGQAKPYQVRQFLRLVERYDLSLENEK